MVVLLYKIYKIKMKKFISFGSVLAFTPFLVFAADARSIILTLHTLLNYIIPVLIAIGVVYFIWGVVQYTMSTDDEAKKGARSKIIQGLIGLFVIVSFWGIINVFTNTFGVGPVKGPTPPCIENPAAGIYC